MFYRRVQLFIEEYKLINNYHNMRNIKKYMTEDAFAQAENNSGYPYDSMTTARPGMAYVKENRNVYFNASPLPPPPELKYYYYFIEFVYRLPC